MCIERLGLILCIEISIIYSCHDFSEIVATERTAMFESLSIENYKSIRTLPDFRMNPISVLIGANNSGKSNFLDVFAFLRDATQYSDPENTERSGWKWPIEKRGGWKSICFGEEMFSRITIADSYFRYHFEIQRDGQYDYHYDINTERLTSVEGSKKFFERHDRKIEFYDNGTVVDSSDLGMQTALASSLTNNKLNAQAKNFAQNLSSIKIYDSIHTEKGSPIRQPQKPNGSSVLNENGDNLVNVLAQLSQLHERFRIELNSLLKILYPDFSRISFPTNERGEPLIRWEDVHGRVAYTPQLSDGTLKFLCMLAILKNPSPPSLIGIDEPDAKLHPRMQSIFADLIHEAGERAQIIATTHNPDFVSLFDPAEIVIVQQHMGATEMRRLSNKAALDLWLEDFTIRKLWLMGELESRWQEK
ncbi:MAG: AAA family ATPase [bacterium]